MSGWLYESDSFRTPAFEGTAGVQDEKVAGIMADSYSFITSCLGKTAAGNSPGFTEKGKWKVDRRRRIWNPRCESLSKTRSEAPSETRSETHSETRSETRSEARSETLVKEKAISLDYCQCHPGELMGRKSCWRIIRSEMLMKNDPLHMTLWRWQLKSFALMFPQKAKSCIFQLTAAASDTHFHNIFSCFATWITLRHSPCSTVTPTEVSRCESLKHPYSTGSDSILAFTHHYLMDNIISRMESI